MFGVEGDAAWTNFGDSVTVIFPAAVFTAKSEADAIATIRGRIGYAFDRGLLYATGGGAWIRNTISVTAAGAGFAVGISDSQNHVGYAAGAGFEYAFGGGWSAKVEYLYLGLGSETYFAAAGGLASGDFNIHTGKLGINYRFGAN